MTGFELILILLQPPPVLSEEGNSSQKGASISATTLWSSLGPGKLVIFNKVIFKGFANLDLGRGFFWPEHPQRHSLISTGSDLAH